MNTNNPKKPIKSKEKDSQSETEVKSNIVSTFIKPVDPKDLAMAERRFGNAMVNYIYTKDVDQAVKLMEKVLSTEPDKEYISNLTHMGICNKDRKVNKDKLIEQIGSNAWHNVVEGLKVVISLNPEYLDAYYNLAICYSETREVDKSIEYFKKVIELVPDPKNPMHESARFNMSNQLVMRRKYQEAVEQLEKILENNPKVIDTLYNAAFIYFKHLKNYDKAIEYFDKILKIYALHLDARYNLGLCYYLKENKEKAMEIWEQLVQVYANYGPAYYNLALTNRELGRNDKARIFFQKYLDIPVKDPGQYLYAKNAKRRLKQLQEESNKQEAQT